MNENKASDRVRAAVPGFFDSVGRRVLDSILADAGRVWRAYDTRLLGLAETIAALESVALAARAWCGKEPSEISALAQEALEEAVERLARGRGMEFANTNTNTRDPSPSYETESEIESEGPLANSSSDPDSSSSAGSDSDSPSESARGDSDSDSYAALASRSGFDAQAIAAAARRGWRVVSAEAAGRLLGHRAAGSGDRPWPRLIHPEQDAREISEPNDEHLRPDFSQEGA